MRTTDSPAILVAASLLLLIGTALSESEQQPSWSPAGVLDGTTPLAFPAVLRSTSAQPPFGLIASTTTSSITSLPSYFRDEDFFILDYDENSNEDGINDNASATIAKSAERRSLFVVPRRILNHPSRHVRRAIASALSGILAGVMSPQQRSNSRGSADIVLPALAAVAFVASTVWIKTVLLIGSGSAPSAARERPESSSSSFKKALGNEDTTDDVDTVPTTTVSDDDGSSVETLESASMDTGTNVIIEQAKPDAVLVAAESSNEKENDTISKEQYVVLLEEVTNLKSLLHGTESKMEELQKQLRRYELLQKQHDMELQEAVQRERQHGQELVRTMQRAMVSVMKKERDDLVADFQKQATLLKGMLLNEES